MINFLFKATATLLGVATLTSCAVDEVDYSNSRAYYAHPGLANNGYTARQPAPAPYAAPAPVEPAGSYHGRQPNAVMPNPQPAPGSYSAR